jgi:hypothetical protein
LQQLGELLAGRHGLSEGWAIFISAASQAEQVLNSSVQNARG